MNIVEVFFIGLTVGCILGALGVITISLCMIQKKDEEEEEWMQ